MNTHADKTQDNKSQTVAAETSQIQNGGESTFQFADNRPEAVVQRKLQEMANNSPQAKQAAQLQAVADNHSVQQQQPIQKKENNTSLPDSLKTGMENLSGMSLDDVKVHRNSDRPAQLQARAYAQGTDIHLGPGQEKHLPHEAWHVVQQKQGRVKPTMQIKGEVNVNDDAGLEREAGVMGDKAIQMKEEGNTSPIQTLNLNGNIIQTKGSGGVKIGFDYQDGEDKEEGIELLKESSAAAKKVRHELKKSWMEDKIKGDKFKGQGSATKVYAGELDDMDEEKDMLIKTEAFLSKKLILKENNSICYKKDEDSEEVHIADLLLGADAYVKIEGETERDLFNKKGLQDKKTSSGNAKEYVNDNEGVKTRRYAYVEKNYYQMMDFFKLGKMTGRFQQNMKAGGSEQGPETMSAGVASKVISGRVNEGQKLTSKQIAIAHQEMGSSPEQRGVSLSSTEKIGGTVGNGGSNFRTKDGFRLKIDLAKVPEEVLLLNDYSHGGIIDQNLRDEGVKKITNDTKTTSKSAYKFGASVRKNRELYIDHVDPAWVVEIEHHQNGGYGEGEEDKTTLGEEETFESVGATYSKYWEGFDAELKETDKSALTDSAATKGIASAKLVKAGYAFGKTKGDAVTALEAHEEVAASPLKDEYAQYHLGYIRARVGKENFKSADDYAAEMK